MKTTKEKIEIMKAFEEGKIIQIKTENRSFWDDWGNNKKNEPCWNWENNDYRIKPEIEYMNCEDIFNKLKEQKLMTFKEIRSGNIVAVNTIDFEKQEIIIVDVTKCDFPNRKLSFSIFKPFELKDNYTFLDGTGFEKK